MAAAAEAAVTARTAALQGQLISSCGGDAGCALPLQGHSAGTGTLQRSSLKSFLSTCKGANKLTISHRSTSYQVRSCIITVQACR